MEMAEKDEAEGRCPACRTPYDKERIVGTAASCERLVAEVNMDKKHKTQKAKPKASDNRKQLTSVRVIQRNLVYIVGLPIDLADEDLLQRKEYFGRYGKVLKVSISRTSSGAIQQFPNSTCSVYITYGREDEAVRCIQSVHAFILDGRALRACFGTTKYCHAWLRNVPCNNPDCLYLHDVGSLEDSFTKDEIISAYSRVQEITGITNNMQRRAGNVLPPPSDDYCNDTSAGTGKPVAKSSLSNLVNNTRVSPPSSSSGRSSSLPSAAGLQNPVNNTKISPPSSSSGRSNGLPSAASWGARVSNCNPPTGSLATSNGPTKQKGEAVHGQSVTASVVSGTPQSSKSPTETGKTHDTNEETRSRPTKTKLETLDTTQQLEVLKSNTSVSETSSTTSAAAAVKSTCQPPCSLKADLHEGEGSKLHKTRYSLDKRPPFECEERILADVNSRNLADGVSSSSVNRKQNGDYSEVPRPIGLSLDNFISHRDQGLQLHESEKRQEYSGTSSKTPEAINSSTDTSELYNLNSDVQVHALQNMTSETEDDFDNQRLNDAIVSQPPMTASSPRHIFSHLRAPSQPLVNVESIGSYSVSAPIVDRVSDEGVGVNLPTSLVSSNGFLEHLVNRAAPGNSLLNDRRGNHIGQFDGEVAHVDLKPTTLDMGESNIISNILSLDLNSWDDSLTSPQNLAMMLTDKQECPIQSTNSWRSQSSNQSRFSFARQEDSRNHLFDVETTLGNIGHTTNNSSLEHQAYVDNRDLYMDRLGNGSGFAHHNMEVSDNFFGAPSAFPPSKLSASRSPISAPPGFNAPSRPPPPGFSSQDRSDQSFDFFNSGNQLPETSLFLRNSYQNSSNGNLSSANDIEFMDPAILAVGKGRFPAGANSSGIDMRQNFPSQVPGFDNESRLQFLMQRSSPNQNLRYTDARDNFSPSSEAYGFNYRHMEQPQANTVSPFSQFSLQQPRNTIVSNGHRDGWSELQSPNDMGIAELLRNDRLGLNKFYGGYEDSKFRMTNSGDLYNRSFGM